MVQSATSPWMKKWAKVGRTLSVQNSYTGVTESGSLDLDLALQTGGIPYGSVARIWGPESVGKSTLVQRMAANWMAQGKPVFWFDFEVAMKQHNAESNGIDLDNPLFNYLTYNPKEKVALTYNNSADFVIDMLSDPNSAAYAMGGALFVMDTLEAAVTNKEEAAGMSDNVMMAKAQVSARFLPKILVPLRLSNSIFVAVQQARANATPMSFEKEMAGGGYPWKHFPDIEIRLQRIGNAKYGSGSTIRATIKKNRYAKMKVQCDYQLRVDDGSGIDLYYSLTFHGLAYNILNKTGNTISFPDGAKTVGFENARLYLKEHPAIMDTVQAGIFEAAKGALPAEMTIVTEEDETEVLMQHEGVEPIESV